MSVLRRGLCRIAPAYCSPPSGKIDFNTISSMNALPFSRTIPVRTPQSASRTEESKSWMSRGLVADRRSYRRFRPAVFSATPMGRYLGQAAKLVVCRTRGSSISAQSSRGPGPGLFFLLFFSCSFLFAAVLFSFAAVLFPFFSLLFESKEKYRFPLTGECMVAPLYGFKLCSDLGARPDYRHRARGVWCVAAVLSGV